MSDEERKREQDMLGLPLLPRHLVEVHHYVVTFSAPGTPEKLWRRSLKLSVIADTVETACKRVRLDHPEATIHGVAHRGKIDLMQIGGLVVDSWRTE